MEHQWEGEVEGLGELQGGAGGGVYQRYGSKGQGCLEGAHGAGQHHGLSRVCILLVRLVKCALLWSILWLALLRY